MTRLKKTIYLVKIKPTLNVSSLWIIKNLYIWEEETCYRIFSKAYILILLVSGLVGFWSHWMMHRGYSWLHLGIVPKVTWDTILDTRIQIWLAACKINAIYNVLSIPLALVSGTLMQHSFSEAVIKSIKINRATFWERLH